MFDVLIKNGTVVDGSGNPRFQADVGVENGRITLVGAAGNAEAREIIDATGKIVCPGFVDPHSHGELSLCRDNRDELLEPLLRQGITTFVGGNCGMSLAPLPDRHRSEVESYINVFCDLDFKKDVSWNSMGEFMDTLETGGMALNTALLAPHGVLRMAETGQQMRLAADDENERMAQRLEECLAAGCIGMSTGLQYIPGSQSDTRELMRLAQVLKKHDAIFTSHLRSYTDITLDNAIDEVVHIGKEAGIRTQISHLFCIPYMGEHLGPVVRGVVGGLAKLSKWWTVPLPADGFLKKKIDRIMRAREETDTAVDIMPTSSGFTHILAFFPPWALEGSQSDILHRLRDPGERRRIRESIEKGRPEWPHRDGNTWSLNLFKQMGWGCARIMSVATEKNRHCEGRQLIEIAAERGVHPIDAACDLLIEEKGHVLIFESMAEPDDTFTERSYFAGMKHPEVMISTDAILMGGGIPSQLFYGCYPRFIGRYVRDKKMLSLETAIRKTSRLAADHFLLAGRGRIAENAFADIVVFDFDTIGSRASFKNPAVFPDGIEHVFVNGSHVVDNGTYHPETHPGKLLRRGA
jgi:N-acyl-D-amino-acid deacylase